jgi:hypothetical protein
MIFFNNFFRSFGVRTAGQLTNPPMPKVDRLELPRNSMYHYVSESAVDIGPRSDEYLFRHVARPIPMSHVIELLSDKGIPRRVAHPIETEIRKYHQHHRRYRRQLNMTAGLRDQNVPFVMNYGFLAGLYRYQRSMFTEYNRWYNIASTVWQTIGKLAGQTDRHQFIQIRLPRVLPGLTDLRIASESLVDGEVLNYATEGMKAALESADQEWLQTMQVYPNIVDSVAMEAMNQRTLRVFHTPETLMMLELWKWAGPNRHASVISHVDDKYLDRINLLFVESGRWFVVNLGVINRWRVATEEELAANPQANTKGLDPVQLQRRLLRMSMSLFQVRTDVGPEVQLAANAEEPVQAADAQVEQSETQDGHPNAPDSIYEEGDPGEQFDAEQADQEEEHNSVVVLPATNPKVDPKTGQTLLKPDTIKSYDETFDDGKALVETELAEDFKFDPNEDAQIEKDLAELDRLSRHVHDQEEKVDTMDINDIAQPEDGVIAMLNRLADEGMVSAAEYRRLSQLAQAPKSITAPDNKSSLADFTVIQPHQTVITESKSIKDIPTVLDKTMLKSSLLEFDQRYIEELLEKDVAAMVLALQNAGICVTSYEREEVHDVMGSYVMYHVRIVPVQGTASTLHFKLPLLSDDGTYMANGTRYRIRKQKGDMPIRKIAPDRVALTSYYGKLFVSRSEKRVNDKAAWLRNAIMAMGLDNANTTVVNLHPGDMFDNLFECPRLYSTMAMGFRGFTVDSAHFPKKLNFLFDHSKREGLYGEAVVKRLEVNGSIICGQAEGGEYIVMNRDSNMMLITPRDDGQVDNGDVVPDFEKLLDLEAKKAPVEFCELKVLGRTIPLGVILGYQLGLEKLMKALKVTARRVHAGQRLNLEDFEYAIQFADETLIFDRRDTFASMILAGFNEYHRGIRNYSVYEFDRRGVYLNILEAGGRSERYLREIDLMYQMFVDPITKELLLSMHEPVKFQGLLLRSVQMLLSDHHPDELDSKYMRIKGYERMAGAVYAELIRSIRIHNGRPGKNKHPIDLNPYAVWTAIQTDPAKNQVSDINPVENLKDIEAVTFSGTGGRGSRSMTKRTRVYHRNDMGTISESTKDSSDVAINTYLSADPQFDSLRGTSKGYVVGETGATALLSTAALLSPASDKDDAKRVNFVGIQHSHAIACEGYTQAPVRTGYEQILAHRTSDLYAFTAKKDGKVISVTDTGMIVEYADGTRKGIDLGRRYGNAAGLTVAHMVVADVHEGQEFKAGDLLCHNTGFFERDMLNPNGVVWKAGAIVKTVLMESTDTLEDSSAISKRVSGLLMTKTTKVRKIVVNFEQSVRRLVKLGQAVASEDILCIIEDAVTANNNLFDEESLDTLRLLSAQAPQSKSKGVVERIEVFYHGDKEDMSESLRALANTSDRDLAKRHRSAGRKSFTGSTDEGFRVDGEPLALDTMAIQIYITTDVGAGVGDKGVFANQLKTVFGKVMERDLKTESGVIIDCVFGYKSVYDRIVNSPAIIGTTTTLLDVIAKRAVAAYKS